MRWSFSLLAAVLLLVVPRLAWASPGQCVAQLVTLEHDMQLAESDDCVVDPDDPRTVPLCLEAGASAVAPLTVHAISDARIEAAKACASDAPPHEVYRPRDKAPPERSDKAPQAALFPLPAIPVFGVPMRGARLVSDAAAASGHPGGVYRPPRA